MVGQLLRQLRMRRKVSQMVLSLESGVSMKHISFIETGRAAPSKDMLNRLGFALNASQHELGSLFRAAGFAPPDSEPSEYESFQVSKAIDFVLAHHEPFPSLAIDPKWRIVRTNQSMQRCLHYFLGEKGAAKLDRLGPNPSFLRLLLDPELLRPSISNWCEIAGLIAIRSRKRNFDVEHTDLAEATLTDKVLSEIFGGIPLDRAAWDMLDRRADIPVLNLELVRGTVHLKFVSVTTTLGIPETPSLNVRIESLFPADEGTKRLLSETAGGIQYPMQNRISAMTANGSHQLPGSARPAFMGEPATVINFKTGT